MHSLWIFWLKVRVYNLSFACFSSTAKFHYLLTLFCLFLQINCVTFPHPDVMPEQQLLKPSEWSYCDYFWVSRQSATCHIAAPELPKKWNSLISGTKYKRIWAEMQHQGVWGCQWRWGRSHLTRLRCGRRVSSKGKVSCQELILVRKWGGCRTNYTSQNTAAKRAVQQEGG